jgi:hypothetical protein
MNFEQPSETGETGLTDNPFTDGQDEPANDTTATGGPLQRLFNGDAPGPSTGELEQEYGMSKHQAVAGRGVLRTATGSGVPPIFEILFGAGMWFMAARGEGGISIGSDDDDGGTGRPGVDPATADPGEP